jgi:uncharacterized protein (TIGR04255 family)
MGIEMSGWLYDEANPIASFTVGAELAGAISPSFVREISARHHLFKRELPRKLEQPFFLFPMPGMPIQPAQNQIAGVVFDSVNQDGSVARSLTVGPNQVAYMTASYTRWKEFLPVWERLLGEMFQLLRSGPPVTAFLLTAVNRFRWQGDSSQQGTLESLLNQESRLFAPNILTTSEDCHSFHGYVEQRTDEPKGQYIRNINIQTGNEPSGGRGATILLSHRLSFSNPVTNVTDLFGPSEAQSFAAKLATEMHDRNNDMFRDVVNSAVTSEIPGLST